MVITYRKKVVTMKTFTLFVCVILIHIISTPSYAESASMLYKELNLLGGYSDANGFVDEIEMMKNSIGGEYFRRFSNDNGDFLTLDLQTRLTYKPTKNFNDAWDLEIHNAWIEYKLGFGYRLRIGHFDPSFGLEPNSDTHGTILQTLAMKNIGFKSDWGIGFKGNIGYFDYEASVQNGTGMKLKRGNGNFLLSYRIGNPQSKDMLYGLSLMYGKILIDDQMHDLMNDDMSVRKRRIGLDMQIPFRSFLFKGELAYGKDNNIDVLGSLGQVSYIFPFHQALIAEAQVQNWLNGFGKDKAYETMLGFCISYRLTSKITVRADYTSNFNKDDQVFMQFYYFGI